MIVTEYALEFPDDFDIGAIRARVARSHETLREIFVRAERQSIPSSEATDRHAEARLRHHPAAA